MQEYLSRIVVEDEGGRKEFAVAQPVTAEDVEREMAQRYMEGLDVGVDGGTIYGWARELGWDVGLREVLAIEGWQGKFRTAKVMPMVVENAEFGAVSGEELQEFLFKSGDTSKEKVLAIGNVTATLTDGPEVDGGEMPVVSLGAHPYNTGGNGGWHGMMNELRFIGRIEVTSHKAKVSLSNFLTYSGKLERIGGLYVGNLADLTGAFGGCNVLRELPLERLSGEVSMSGFASGCKLVERVVFPKALRPTNLESAFSSCTALREVDFSATKIVGPCSMKYMTRGCNLPVIKWPAGQTEVGSLEEAFTGMSCPVLDLRGLVGTGAITNIANSNVVEEIIFDEGLTPNNVNYAFRKCGKLRKISGLNIGKVEFPYRYGYEYYNALDGCKWLCNMTLVGLGEKAGSFLAGIPWGLRVSESGVVAQEVDRESEEFQSVVTTLRGAYDRVSAGLGVVVVTLNQKIVDALDDELIAEVTAKGITLLGRTVNF